MNDYVSPYFKERRDRDRQFLDRLLVIQKRKEPIGTRVPILRKPMECAVNEIDVMMSSLRRELIFIKDSALMAERTSWGPPVHDAIINSGAAAIPEILSSNTTNDDFSYLWVEIGIVLYFPQYTAAVEWVLRYGEQNY